METYDVRVEPASPRLTAMLSAAFDEEGVTVDRIPNAPLQESHDAETVMSAMSLGFAGVTFIVTAADSDAVKRAISKVNDKVGNRLRSSVTPRHKK